MIRNLSQNTVITEYPMLATGLWTRARGMIGRNFNGFDAMIFPRCSSVHTWFMRQPLDMIFVDPEKRVLGLQSKVCPWKLVFGPQGTETIIELPSGRLKGLPLGNGDILSW